MDRVDKERWPKRILESQFTGSRKRETSTLICKSNTKGRGTKGLRMGTRIEEDGCRGKELVM